MIKYLNLKTEPTFTLTKNKQNYVLSNKKVSLTLDDLSYEIFIMLTNNASLVDIFNHYKKKTLKDDATSKRDVFLFIYTLVNNNIVKNTKTDDIFRKPFECCMIEITNTCNFKCPHCYVDKQKPFILTKENIKNISKDLESLHCHHITLTGGEPLSHPDFKEIYKYLYENNFLVSLNTNGSMLNEEYISFFEQYPPLSIEVSLYGTDDKTYYNFTKTQVSFDLLTKNILNLKNKNINVVLKNVLTSSNEENFYNIKNFANKLNIPFKSDYLVFPQTFNKSSFNNEQASNDYIIQYLQQQQDVESYFIALFNKKQSNSLFLCNKNKLSIFINSHNKVCLCPCMQDFGIDYKKTELPQIINNIHSLLKKRLSASSPCYNCTLKPICRYCPGKFFMSTGSLKKPPEWFCKTSQSIYDKFIKGIKILPVKEASLQFLKSCFSILKNNLQNQGFQISNNDFKIWMNNIKKSFSSSFWFAIYNNGRFCGFMTLSTVNTKLFVSEIQFADSIKNSRAILKCIEFLTSYKPLSKHKECYFNINNKNTKSLHTFSHLQPELISSNSNTSLYILSRQNIQHYLSSKAKNSTL